MSFDRAERESLDRPITTPGQILVEGRSSEIFFREFVEKLSYTSKLEVRTFGGKDKDTLQTYLEIFTKRPAFKERVRTLGLIRDAEDKPAESAFQAVCAAFRAANLSVPDEMRILTNNAPRVAVYILPDCSGMGMLETLCLESIRANGVSAHKSSMECVDEFLVCLDRHGTHPKNETKAKLGAYLVSQNVYEAQVGRAAQIGLFNWDSTVLESLRTFLTVLATDVVFG